MKNYLAPIAALVLAVGITGATVQQAEAGHKGGRVAAGIAAGLLAGALLYNYQHSRAHAHSYRRTCYRGPRRCRRVRKCWYDDWGYRHCKTRTKCWRPRYCD